MGCLTSAAHTDRAFSNRTGRHIRPAIHWGLSPLDRIVRPTSTHQRWTLHGRPAVEQFRAATGPVAERAGSEMVDAFDLSALAVQPRLEVGYILQCRHDDRSVRIPPSRIRHLVGLLVDSGAASLLDRPLDLWLDAIRARGWKDPRLRLGSGKTFGTVHVDAPGHVVFSGRWVYPAEIYSGRRPRWRTRCVAQLERENNELRWEHDYFDPDDRRLVAHERLPVNGLGGTGPRIKGHIGNPEPSCWSRVSQATARPTGAFRSPPAPAGTWRAPRLRRPTDQQAASGRTCRGSPRR